MKIFIGIALPSLGIGDEIATTWCNYGIFLPEELAEKINTQNSSWPHITLYAPTRVRNLDWLRDFAELTSHFEPAQLGLLDTFHYLPISDELEVLALDIQAPTGYLEYLHTSILRLCNQGLLPKPDTEYLGDKFKPHATIAKLHEMHPSQRPDLELATRKVLKLPSRNWECAGLRIWIVSQGTKPWMSDPFYFGLDNQERNRLNASITQRQFTQAGKN